MIKADIVQELYTTTGVDKNVINIILDKLCIIIRQLLIDGEEVTLRGLGSFMHKKRDRKVARHIRENTAIIINPHFIPYFKFSKDIVTEVKESEVLLLRL